MGDGRQISIILPIALAVVIHGALAGGVEGAKRLGWFAPKPRPQVVEFVVDHPKPKPAEPPPPPRVDPPKQEPPPPPPPVEAKKPKIAQKVDPKAPPPPPEPDVPPPAEQPAPGPASDDAPPSEYTYQMPAGAGGGTMGVKAGAKPTGSGRGVKGGKGTGTGGGAPADSQGTGGEPKAASIASVKSQPDPIGDYDHVTLEKKDYPDEARLAGIEGDVQVKILVDADGNPTSVKLVKGLGHGLDQKAIALARKLRFKPALDTDDKPVAFWVPWTFHFRLPD